jgi:hypothetical protein
MDADNITSDAEVETTAAIIMRHLKDNHRKWISTKALCGITGNPARAVNEALRQLYYHQQVESKPVGNKVAWKHKKV